MKKQAKIIVGMGVKAFEGASARLTQALFNLAPETARQVEIKEMEKDLDETLEGVVVQRREWENFEKEAVDAEALRKQRLVAAEEIQSVIKSGNVAGQSLSDNEDALEELVGMIESDEARVEFLRQRADSSKEILDAMQAEADELGQQLKEFVAAVEKAKLDQRRAELDLKHAEQESDSAARLAGLRKKSEARSTVLDAVNQRTQKLRDKAAAVREKTKILEDSKKGKENEIIAAAMAKAAGAEPEPEVSLTDRLAALKNK